MISGDVLLSAMNTCRKLGSRLYSPEPITFRASVSAPLQFGVRV